ncbi:MAG: hypothetical protein WCV56_05820 [Candidatus Omnitrophota bacterium]
MGILEGLYTTALRNRYFLFHAVIRIIETIAKREAGEARVDKDLYLGDNLPLDLAKGIRNI